MEKLSKSYLQEYIKRDDLKKIAWRYEEHYLHAMRQKTENWNAVLLDEIRFRAKYFQNIVFSIEGQQGAGKSMGLLRLSMIIAQIFGSKFTVDNIHFFPEDFEQGLKNAPPKSVLAMDEQPRAHGLGSGMIEDQLANFEDILRKPQINIGYASPSLRKHEHFFVFEALGDIRVNEQGNPSSVELLLKTKKMTSAYKELVPRGIIRLSCPDKEFWDAYNAKKDSFIQKMKEGGWMSQTETIKNLAAKVIKDYGDKLLRHTPSGVKTAGRDTIDYYITLSIGDRQFTSAGKVLVRAAIQETLKENK